MKKILLILPLISFMLLESCSDDFNVNAPNQDVYILNCILRNDSNIQYATISKNLFTENGVSPSPTDILPNIKGADIKIFNNDSVFVMRDTTVQLTQSGITTMVDFYYIKNLTLIPGNVIRIEATVPGGKKLESSIQVPNISYNRLQTNFPQLFMSTYQTRPKYSWSWIENKEGNANILSIPRLEIHYKKYEDGTYANRKTLVPLAAYFTYDRDQDLLIPVYVKLSFNNFCVTTLDSVNKTMQKISGNDPDKKKYIITKVLFNVIGLDSELSKYNSAYDVYSENFTIKLRQTDFSNISGGKGVFGVYYVFSKPLNVDNLYINSFGYQYNPE